MSSAVDGDDWDFLWPGAFLLALPHILRIAPIAFHTSLFQPVPLLLTPFYPLNTHVVLS